MNRLRNPWVIGGTVALLLVVGVGAFFLLQPRPVRKAGAWAPFPGSTAAANPVGAKPTPTNGWPEAPMDYGLIQTNLARWADEPERDPFQMSETVVEETVQNTNSRISLLKLKAIWRQTGGRAVVINERILMEGDSIEGLKVERIEADRVWLKGPERTEALIFGQAPLPPPPPAALRKGVRGIFGPEAMPPPKATKPRP
jgi:hypothetical protein